MNNEWQEWEKELLREHYPKRGVAWDGWETLLPDRSGGAIRTRANSLGLKHEGWRIWEPEEDAILRLHYQTKPKDWDGWRRLLPGKTRKQIAGRAWALGLKSPKGGWTDEARKDLVLSVKGVSERTGHSFTGCICELNYIRKKHDEKRRGE